MMKRTGVLLAVLCASMAVPARADDASKRAKVEELFTVLKVNRLTEQITSSVRRQMDASMRSLGGGQMNAEQKKLLDDYEAKVMGVVDETVSWKVLEPQMLELYTTTYSEAEIDGILAFYKGPVGQAMLAKTPELTQKSMEITQTKLAGLQPRISEMAQQFAQKFAAAAGPSPAPASGGTTAKPTPK